MKLHSAWSYDRFLPLFFDGGDIYICRLVPGEGTLTFETKEPPAKAYDVFYRVRGSEEWLSAGQMTGTVFTLSGLADLTDYELYVSEGEKKSRVRLFRTGASFGTVINYLHPDDTVYSFSGRYLCSPSIVRHPDGFLLASMDLFAGNYPQNLTLIFRSDDDGATWHHVTELFPCFWGKMFIHRGQLYMFGVSTEYGDMLIGKSTDGGKTWSAPVTLLRGCGGKNGEVGVHRNPETVLTYGGRIWNTVEWGSWGRGYHAPMVVSAPEDSDLLDPESWTFSEPVRYDKSWKGLPAGESTGNIEGALTVFPDGKLYNVMRYDMGRMKPNFGKALVYRVDTEQPEKPLTFVRTMDFPANHSKFVILYDPVSGYYVSIATRIIDAEHAFARNLLSLMVSRDMVTWRTVLDIYDKLDCDPAMVGFQYVDFLIEGDDLLFATRIGWNGAHNFHDSNFSCFDRISDFRKYL